MVLQVREKAERGRAERERLDRDKAERRRKEREQQAAALKAEQLQADEDQGKRNAQKRFAELHQGQLMLRDLLYEHRRCASSATPFIAKQTLLKVLFNSGHDRNAVSRLQVIFLREKCRDQKMGQYSSACLICVLS